MTEKEKRTHESYVKYVNELLTKNNRKIVGVSTSKHDEDDDISSVTIRIAPSEDDE